SNKTTKLHEVVPNLPPPTPTEYLQNAQEATKPSEPETLLSPSRGQAWNSRATPLPLHTYLHYGHAWYPLPLTMDANDRNNSLLLTRSAYSTSRNKRRGATPTHTKNKSQSCACETYIDHQQALTTVARAAAAAPRDRTLACPSSRRRACSWEREMGGGAICPPSPIENIISTFEGQDKNWK
ncbi:unnamed protein product, partial [Ectocarpus sp. 13 AM-2016]